jgi:hypothetical protein
MSLYPHMLCLCLSRFTTYKPIDSLTLYFVWILSCNWSHSNICIVLLHYLPTWQPCVTWWMVLWFMENKSFEMWQVLNLIFHTHTHTHTQKHTFRYHHILNMMGSYTCIITICQLKMSVETSPHIFHLHHVTLWWYM